MPHNWVLEDRTCLCGCEKTFRVLPESKARYASFWHENPHESWFEIDGERIPKTKQGLNDYYQELKNPDETDSFPVSDEF